MTLTPRDEGVSWAFLLKKPKFDRTQQPEEAPLGRSKSTFLIYSEQNIILLENFKEKKNSCLRN